MRRRRTELLPLLEEKAPIPFHSRWVRKRSHVINTSRQRLSWACLSLRARKRRKKWGQPFKQHPHSPRNEINELRQKQRLSSPLSFRTSCYLLLSCRNSALYQYITWFIWQSDHGFVVGMQASGRENSLSSFFLDSTKAVRLGWCSCKLKNEWELTSLPGKSMR